MGCQSEDTFTAQMQSILCIALDLKEATAVSNPSTARVPHSPIIISPINIPSPHSILPSLLEAGISSEIASAASQIYQQRAEQLRQRIQETIATACRTATEFPADTSALSPDVFVKRVTCLFTDIYSSRMKEWKEEIIQRIKQASEATSETPKDFRAFNQEYVPLLEHFFKENPFPTRTDKLFLAKKSNMQYRQIHVWFQNRRNRSKKEGKTLRKKPPHEGVAQPLVYGCMKSRKVESDSQVARTYRVSSSGPTEPVTRNSTLKDELDAPAPLHAFPSSYPPTCRCDPFPCKSGPTHFSRPEWERVPSRKLSPPLSTSIDELIDRFSQLNVRDESRPKGFPKSQSYAATAAITVIPSHAPHSSLLLSEYHQSTNIVPLYPIVRAGNSSSKAFLSSSSFSKPITLVPLSTPLNGSKFPDKRKTAPLPRRFPAPSRTRNTCRNITPSDSSSTSPASPRLSSPDF